MENSVTADKATNLEKLVRYFEEAESVTESARLLSERDRDYYDNDQYTAEELAVYKKRKQAPLVINYIKRKVDFMRGFERRTRTDPKAYPRNPQDEKTAEAATDSLRYIADLNDFDEIRSGVFENLLIEGAGAVDVVVEQKETGYDIIYKPIAWDRFFYDPHSRARDFSDAKYMGIVLWMDKEEVLETYPGSEEILESTFTSMSNTYDDRPRYSTWCDNRRTRVRVVQMHWYEGGEWMMSVFTKGGYLVEPQVSPYLDRDGRSACSIIARSAYIDRDNNRYGSVRDWIGLQDEINKRRSKALHLLNVRQVKYEKGAVVDAEAARRELNKPDGMVEVTPNMMFDIMPTGDMAAAQFNLLQQATQEMQASGPNASMSGKDSRDLSGRALQAMQQGGATEMEPLMDELKCWSRDVYEATWQRVRQFWTEEKWLRVTDDEKNLKWVGLNRRVTLKDKLMEMPQEQAMAYLQQNGIYGGDPRLDEVIDVENVAAEVDVDIVIEESPDFATLQTEQFEQLTQMAQAGMQIPPKVIIKASSLRNKDELIDILEGKAEDGISPEVQQLQQQLQELQQMADGMAKENEALKGDRVLKMAEIEVKNKEADIKSKEADTKAFEAETDRIQAMTQPQEPQEQTEAQPTQQQMPMIPINISTENMQTSELMAGLAQAVIASTEQSAITMENLAGVIVESNKQIADSIIAAQSAPKVATLSNGKKITVETL